MEDRTCLHCAKPFTPVRVDALHCSKRCTSLGWYHRTKKLPAHRERSCPVCDEAIQPTSHANRVYCSVKCRDVVKIITSHGIDLEQYRAMLAAQNGVCAICGGADSSWRPGERGWHIDHDHATGRVRGLLCGWCNLMIGYARDNPSVLIAAAKYLQS